MAITVYGLAIPTNLAATLNDGGSLIADNTYYWKVCAANGSYSISANQRGVRSAPSAEGSFTTTSTKKSVTLTWDAVTAHYGTVQYNLYILSTTGNWTRQNVSIVSNSVTITSFTTSNVTDTFVLYNPNLSTYFPTKKLFGNLDPNVGGICVEISGNVGNITYDNIKSAIDSAGYSGNCYYSGYEFNLIGNIYVAINSIGSLKALSKVINFIHGNCCSASSNFCFQFGEYDSINDRTYNGCTLGWYGWSTYFHTDYAKIYDTTISVNKLPGVAYIWGGDTSLAIAAGSDIRDVTLQGVGTRSYATPPKNLKITNPADLRYYFSGTAENCQFLYASGIIHYLYTPSFRNCIFKRASTSAYHFNYNANTVVKFYDCTFIDTTDNLPRWYQSPTVNYDFKVYNSLIINIVDVEGNYISDAKATLINNISETIFELYTDENGDIDAVDILIHTQTNLASTSLSPFILTVSKEGYETYTARLSLVLATNASITLNRRTGYSRSRIVNQ